jgi:2-polyprenyl-6-hydroxyphenyl methylase/3-demethylubiquinone-9 3-methyltransferase
MAVRKNITVEQDEIDQFSRYAADWWNPHGALKPLHRLNPVRLAYLRDQILGQGLGKADLRQPLKGVSLLDVGCGGGLLAEPLARLGALVTGLDASAEAIAEARRHAEISGLAIDYCVGSADEMASDVRRFDVVTALEIVEHVAELDVFVGALAQLVKPGGVLVFSTLNRTLKSFLLGIVAAEYVLRWVPKGTHRWSKFVRPSELVRRVELHGLTAADLTGVVYRPVADTFVLSPDDLDVNYMLTAVKK